jgi:hypothetical protein
VTVSESAAAAAAAAADLRLFTCFGPLILTSTKPFSAPETCHSPYFYPKWLF